MVATSSSMVIAGGVTTANLPHLFEKFAAVILGVAGLCRFVAHLPLPEIILASSYWKYKGRPM